MTSLRCRALAGLPIFSTLALAALLISAGPLTPPAGPVASTAKPLADIEPRIAINATNTPGTTNTLFQISQPGSYYFTGNITGVTGKHGIQIITSGVTIDLNGFELTGAAGGFSDGIIASASNLTNITVLNGSIRNWTVRAVYFGARNCRISGILASGNQSGGINGGAGVTISNCSSYLNASGISAGDGSTITNCTAFNNTNTGITTGEGCVVTNCSANSNSGVGITLGIGGTLTDCTAGGNGLDGIKCSSACVIRSNTCRNNGSDGNSAGIHATGGANRIEGNHCSGAATGMRVDASRNFIIRNTCATNTTDWFLAANNVIGPIQNHHGSIRPGVFGFSMDSAIGTVNDNFSY